MAAVITWMTSVAGFSLALGAFLAGFVLANSEYGHQADNDERDLPLALCPSLARPHPDSRSRLNIPAYQRARHQGTVSTTDRFGGPTFTVSATAANGSATR